MTTHAPDCIFCKIAAGQIPARKVYEDDDIFAFHDIAPWAPVHFLMIPKRHIASMAQLSADDAALMGKIMTLAPKLALEQGCEPYPNGGFRVVVNTGAHGGQEVPHLHVHLIPRYKGDQPDPRGGVRWIFPERADYWSVREGKAI